MPEHPRSCSHRQQRLSTFADEVWVTILEAPAVLSWWTTNLRTKAASITSATYLLKQQPQPSTHRKLGPRHTGTTKTNQRRPDTAPPNYDTRVRDIYALSGPPTPRHHAMPTKRMNLMVDAADSLAQNLTTCTLTQPDGDLIAKRFR